MSEFVRGLKDKETELQYKGNAFLRLLGYLKPYIKTVLICFVLVGVLTALDLIKPMLIGDAIDKYILTIDTALEALTPDERWHGILKTAGLYIAVMLIAFVCNRAQYLMIQEMGQKIVYTLRMELMEHVQSLSMRFFDTTPVGRIVTRITNDTEAINDLYSNIIVRLFRNVIKVIGLEDFREDYPAQLSGGQKQRVAIARALASDPDVLLCDEATSALDPMTTQSILALLQEINRDMGITVVLITHEMAVIRQICNKVAILDGGKLAEEGSVDDVFMHTKSAAGRRLFGILPDQEEVPPQPAIRIVFDGSTAGQPIISKLVKDLGMDVNILSADVRQLNGKSFGQMMIARPEDPSDVKRVMEYLRAASMTVEEVHV